MRGMSERARAIVGIVLAVVGAATLLVGTAALYARSQIVDQEAFADRAVAALDDDEVRQLVGRQIVIGLIDRGSTDLVAARPLIESVVDGVLRTGPFRRLVRQAAIEANRTFFVRDHHSIALDLSDAAKVVRFAARSVSPRVARELPRDVEPELLKLQRREFAADTLRAADQVRRLGILLPLLALLAFVASVAISPDRRIGVLRAGVAAGAVGVVLAAALMILNARLLAGVVGPDEVTDAEMRGAVAGLLEAYFGDLVRWAFAIGLAGIVVGGAAAALDRGDVEAPAARLRHALLTRPRRRSLQALRAAALLLAGIAIALEPTLSLRVAAVLLGAFLVFAATGELLSLLQRRGVAPAHARRLRRRALAAAAGVAVLVVTGAVVGVLALTDEDEPAAPTSAALSGPLRCNGSRDLCALRLNEAVFAGTHNSFSAADSPNWFITNQRRTIRRQLADGIRLFLIDPHWGVADGDKVRTDFDAEGRDRNRVAKSMPPAVLAAAQRLAGRFGLGRADAGEREVWLCHTVCELGATRMSDALDDVRAFLDRNRGEVVILFVEPYVPPREIARAVERAGLERYVATLDRSEPLPTLGRLVRANRRLVVFTEKDADGTVPWYLDGFSFVQDTPLGAQRREQLSCRRARGTAHSPLLMLNHWADLFPPQLTPNRAFQTRRFLLRRAHECARRRGMPVNMIAVDFYDQGDLIKAVDELNRERVRAVRRERTLAVADAGG